MQKQFIQNRKGQKIAVIVDEPENASGLAFVMHGLSGFKEQSQIEVMAKTFVDHGYTTVRFDTTNTLGESDGNYEDATVTNYFEDLEDVIAWSKTRPWFQTPFALTGHSLGGMCTTLYAEQHPEEVKLLAPISSVISGALSLDLYEPEELADWEKSGWHVSERRSKPGVTRRLAWSHVADRLKYDLLPNASKLMMPVMLVIGENDDLRPHQQFLLDKLPGPKELHISRCMSEAFCDRFGVLHELPAGETVHWRPSVYGLLEVDGKVSCAIFVSATSRSQNEMTIF